ncbi:hypothetical protein ACPSL3_09990 [Vibrio owensii]|uniref:hypothetical protein n=1 Tax=Vibrio owensii TaxID=696485 RepID=UPI003CE46CB1
MSAHKEKWWFPLYEFGMHILIGTVVFVLIAVPAILLNIWITSLKGTVDELIILVLTGVEYVLFFVDVLLFAIYIIRTTIKAGKELWAQ